MNKQSTRIRNWHHYNRALINRGSITFWLNDEAVSDWYYRGKQKPGGKLIYSDLAVKVSLTIKEVYRLAYRQTQGLVDSLFKILNIGTYHSPHYTRLCRRIKDISIEFTEKARTSSSVCVLVDSTGIKVFGESEWYSYKHIKNMRRKWRKLHICVNHETQTILSAELTAAYVHDASHFHHLIEDLPKNKDVKTIIGDGSYSLHRCHVVAKKKKAKLIAPPHRNSRKQCENRNYRNKEPTPERDSSIDFIRRYSSHTEGLKSWKDFFLYHRRSLVETAMFRLKTNFGEYVRAKSLETQQQIMLIRCDALNKMTSLGMPKYHH